MHAHPDDVVLREHVLVVALGVLPLLEQVGGRLVGRLVLVAPGPQLRSEVAHRVVGDVLARVVRRGAVQALRPEVPELGVVVEVVIDRHVLGPGARVGGQGVGDDQRRQARVGAVGVHLLDDEGLDDLRLGGVVDLRPVDPADAPGRLGRGLGGRRLRGRSGSGLRGLQRRLGVGEGLAQLRLGGRGPAVGGVAGGGLRGDGVGVGAEGGVVLAIDPPMRGEQRGAHGIGRGRAVLGEGGDDDEGGRHCSRCGDDRHVRARQLEGHRQPA